MKNNKTKNHPTKLLNEINETDLFLTDEEAREKSEIKHVESRAKGKYSADEQLYRFKNFFIYPSTISNPYASDRKNDLKTDKFVSKGDFLDDLFAYKNAMLEDLDTLKRFFGFPAEDNNLDAFSEVAKRTVEKIVNNKSLRDEIVNLKKKELRFLLNAFYFLPFWLNPLESFDFGANKKRNDLIGSLFYHLFGNNRIPAFLFNVWTESSYSYEMAEHVNAMCLCIILARGERLGSAIQKFNWNIDENICPYLFKVNKSNKKEEGFLQAFVYQNGGKAKDYELIKNLIFLGHYDPLDYSNNIRSEIIKGLYDSVFWIISSMQNSWEETEMITKWAIVQSIEDKNFSINNYSFDEAIKCANEFNDALYKNEYIPKNIITWETRNDDWIYLDEYNESWTIHELGSNIELFHEPFITKDDVYLYAAKCKRGYIRLFSLRLNNESKLALMVDILSGFLVNPLKPFYDTRKKTIIDPPSDKELSIVGIWEEQVLKKFRLNYK